MFSNRLFSRSLIVVSLCLALFVSALSAQGAIGQPAQDCAQGAQDCAQGAQPAQDCAQEGGSDLADRPAQEGAQDGQPAQDCAQEEEPSAPEHSINISIVQCVDPSGAGYIDFVVSSWNFVDSGGLNPDIELQYQVKTGNQVSAYVTYMHGAFTGVNRKFGGTLYLSGDPDSVSLVATALAPWGNGHQPGAMAYKTVSMSECQGSNADQEEPENLRYLVLLPSIYR